MLPLALRDFAITAAGQRYVVTAVRCVHRFLVFGLRALWRLFPRQIYLRCARRARVERVAKCTVAGPYGLCVLLALPARVTLSLLAGTRSNLNLQSACASLVLVL